MKKTKIISNKLLSTSDYTLYILYRPRQAMQHGNIYIGGARARARGGHELGGTCSGGTELN